MYTNQQKKYNNPSNTKWAKNTIKKYPIKGNASNTQVTQETDSEFEINMQVNSWEMLS